MVRKMFSTSKTQSLKLPVMMLSYLLVTSTYSRTAESNKESRMPSGHMNQVKKPVKMWSI